MKVFLSWSGEFSQKAAEKLKKWLPCFIQSIDVFYSQEDIEKGDLWSEKLTNELSECNFGIVCLTNKNIDAPWIHFEAGALSAKLGNRVATIMFNVNQVNITGPLSRFQSTKFEEKDFYQLIKTINNNIEKPLHDTILETTFKSMWSAFYKDISELIKEYRLMDIDDKYMMKIHNINEAKVLKRDSDGYYYATVKELRPLVLRIKDKNEVKKYTAYKLDGVVVEHDVGNKDDETHWLMYEDNKFEKLSKNDKVKFKIGDIDRLRSYRVGEASRNIYVENVIKM